MKKFASILRLGLTKQRSSNEVINIDVSAVIGLGQSSCAFLGGAVVGAGGAGAAYEYNAYRQMQQLEEDYKAERISRAEYEKP
jgi:galactokinase/mevalonate kinase-like predicted kinase